VTELQVIQLVAAVVLALIGLAPLLWKFLRFAIFTMLADDAGRARLRQILEVIAHEDAKARRDDIDDRDRLRATVRRSALPGAGSEPSTDVAASVADGTRAFVAALKKGAKTKKPPRGRDDER
jgi:hypothetical protein